MWVLAADRGEALLAVADLSALRLLGRSVGLAAAVTATGLLVALPAAWLTVRSDLPGRRLWTMLLVLPLAVPSYVGAYLFVSALGPRGLLRDVLGVEALPSIYGFAGAWLVLSLFTFPLLLLPLRAALRRADPTVEDAARTLGRSPLRAFLGTTLPQLRPAIGGGGLLVALYVLSDFGAVSILRYETFTRSIYVSYRSAFDRTEAAALGLLLVAVALLVIALERRARRGEGGLGAAASAPRAPVALGRWRWPALAFCAGVVLLALVLPVGTLGYWTTRAVSGSVDWPGVLAAGGRSLLAASLAAAAAALCALPVARLAARYPGRLARIAETGSWAGHALPGIVVALALVFVGIRAVPVLYQSLAMLVAALVVLFLPQAVAATRAAMLQVPVSLEEAGRTLGRRPAGVLASVTGPLISGGVLAGTALVLLTAAKELPATVVLAPTGFDTLALEVWKATNLGFFERAAVPTLLLLAFSIVPVAILVGRDRAAERA